MAPSLASFYRLSDFDSKDEIDWVFRSDHVTLTFTAVERRYCKTCKRYILYAFRYKDWAFFSILKSTENSDGMFNSNWYLRIATQGIRKYPNSRMFSTILHKFKLHNLIFLTLKQNRLITLTLILL